MSRASCLLAAALVSGCAAAGEPCSVAADCGDATVCVANRCRGADEPVVAPDTRRVIVPANRVAVLGPDHEVDAEVAALGAARSGDLVVLMDFDGRVAVTTEIVAAFLLVDPEPSSPGPTAPIDVAVRPIVASWDLAAVSYGRTPSLGGELTRTRVPPARRAPLRLDVTRFVAKRHGAGLGFALSASGDDPVGARLLMLVESSVGPRLELYLK